MRPTGRSATSSRSRAAGLPPASPSRGGTSGWRILLLERWILSPPYTAVAGRVPLPSRAQLVAAGGEALWAVGGRQLWRIDPGHGRVTARVALSFAPRALAAGDGAVWLVDTQRDRLVRFDPRTRRFTAIHTDPGPVAVSVGNDAVWTANRADGSVTEIDPARNV